MSVRVSQFFEEGGQKLKLQLVAGKSGMHRLIREAAINRPGLALTGFFRYFAHKRIQVIGLAESTFLAGLSREEQRARLRGVFEQRIPCIVVTRNRKVQPPVRELAKELRVPVLRSPLITSHFINQATLIMERLMASRIRKQGTMVDVHGVGVLIEGAAGIGKSEIALALVEKGYSLVSDDVTVFQTDSSGNVLGSAVEVTRYHMQIRGLGIIHVPSLFGVTSVCEEKRLDLVISLKKSEAEINEDGSGLTAETCTILGVEIPRVSIHVAPGRDLAYLVEVAAHNQKLKLLGHDAAKELDAKLISILARKRSN
ncbi:MAG: HPr(Ser) kinase/phosphatase [Kiritimatiellae bacterium]|nr:HPr(Ser) kinase/phosphatase [Kiritimatiellia bacterium]